MAIQNTLAASAGVEGTRTMQERQKVMDANQNPSRQFAHAMWDSRSSITRQQAIQSADSFVRGKLETARASNGGKAFYSNLGDAIHTLQDATSPSHRGFQDWGTQGAVGHVHAERDYPVAGTRERAELEGATRWANDIARGKAEMPKRFFDVQSGQLLLPQGYR